ncbi:MAG: hypothetical protein K9W44_01080 [Candidatus Lokiarchaeota archaeon]|nr:hypothetical protein [Candidatus Harpocratesius repetitus]
MSILEEVKNARKKEKERLNKLGIVGRLIQESREEIDFDDSLICDTLGLHSSMKKILDYKDLSDLE